MPLAPNSWLFPTHQKCGCMTLGRGLLWHTCQHNAKCLLGAMPDQPECQGCKQWGKLKGYVGLAVNEAWDNERQQVINNGH